MHRENNSCISCKKLYYAAVLCHNKQLGRFFHQSIKFTAPACKKISRNTIYSFNVTIRINNSPAAPPAIFSLMDSGCSSLNGNRTNTVSRRIFSTRLSPTSLEFPAIYIVIFHNVNIASTKKSSIYSTPLPVGVKKIILYSL